MLYLLVSFSLFSQVKKEPNATTKSVNEPVPGAGIAVEQVSGHKIVKCKTDSNGEFSISILNIDEFQGKDAKEIKFKITVQPKKIKVMVINKTNIFIFEIIR